MKVRCKANVQDKYTGTMYIAGKEYDLEKERAEEVVNASNGRYFEYVEEVQETKEESKKTTKRAKKSAK